MEQLKAVVKEFGEVKTKELAAGEQVDPENDHWMQDHMCENFITLIANGEFPAAQVKAVASELHHLQALPLTRWYA